VEDHSHCDIITDMAVDHIRVGFRHTNIAYIYIHIFAYFQLCNAV